MRVTSRNMTNFPLTLRWYNLPVEVSGIQQHKEKVQHNLCGSRKSNVLMKPTAFTISVEFAWPARQRKPVVRHARHALWR